MMLNFATRLLLWVITLHLQVSASASTPLPQNDGAAKDSVLASNCDACLKHHQKMIQADPDYENALKYAPILWFADQEEYFPTLPFFTAFDGLNNNEKNDEKLDFNDPQEIAPIDPNEATLQSDSTKQQLASWEILRKWYNRLLDEDDLNALVESRRNTVQMRVNALQAKIDSLNRGLEDLAGIMMRISERTFVDSSRFIGDSSRLQERFQRSLEQMEYFSRGRHSLIYQKDSLSALKRELEQFDTQFAVEQFKARAKAAAKKKLCAVFYNVSKRMKMSDLKTELNNDEQFWHRLEEDHKNYFKNTRANLTVFEYYFYYVYDKGLTGHPHDIERVFVYVPDSIDFRVVAAAGHSNLTPNNVLFYKADEVPEQYKSHLHVLVELGGHSNAPDLKGNGLFEPGVDANWHIENLWGTRDMQARAGSGALGQYASWMTFPRNSSGKIFPPDPALEKLRPKFCYRLLPVKNFRALDDFLAEYENLLKSRSRSSDIDSKKKSFIEKIDSNFADIGLPTTRLTELIANNEIQKNEVEARMRAFLLWRKDMAVLTKTQTGIEPSKKLLQGAALWFDFEYGHRDEFHFNLPKARFSLLLRSPWLLPGVFELHAGADLFETASSSPGINAEVGGVYEKYYTTLLSYYAGALGHVNMEAGQKDYLGLQFGLSAALPLFFQHDNTLRKFRLRLGGVYLDNRSLAPRDRLRFNLQFGYHFQPIPLTDERYVKIDDTKHKIWEHDDYGNPKNLFKRFLFRRRGKAVSLEVNSFGFWLNWMKKESPTYKVSWFMPVRGVFPFKVDGVLEFQAGWSESHFTHLKKWAFVLNYERLFGRLPSWYLSIASSRISYLALDDIGGGLSIMYPWQGGKRLGKCFWILKNLYRPPWLHLRLGIKSSINREALQLSRPRLELQLGIH